MGGLYCPKCNDAIMPTVIEKRLMRHAKVIDAAISRHVGYTRNLPSTPSRSFIGELYMALVESYNLGVKSKGDLKRKGVSQLREGECMKKTVLGVFVLAMSMAAPAKAALVLAGTIGGVNFCATDNNVVCGFGTQLTDIDPTGNRISLAPDNIGGLDIQGSLYTQTIGTHNVLNSGSLLIENNTGATINGSLAVGGTGFLGPITQANVSGSGTWEDASGSTIFMRWFNDPANVQGGLNPGAVQPGILLSTFGDVAGPGTDSFSHTLNGIPVIDPAAFGMTLQFDLSLVANGNLVSRGQTITKDQALVPEPGSMALLGIGLFGVATRLRRRFV